jgi:hypothetical protein
LGLAVVDQTALPLRLLSLVLGTILVVSPMKQPIEQCLGPLSGCGVIYQCLRIRPKDAAMTTFIVMTVTNQRFEACGATAFQGPEANSTS